MKCKALILMAIVAFASLQAQAMAGPILGTAASFAVLGGSTVTNTGSSVITGDLGVSPGTAITGFPPGSVTPPYTIHAADAVALQAQSDVTSAYNFLAGLGPIQNLTGQNLGGLTLTPGVYHFASSAQLTGTLTLNALGNPDALFVFQIGSTLTTASKSSVVEINGGQSLVPGCEVYWQVGSSATIGTDTAFEGSILANTSITLNTGASIVDGRALAQSGAVTLDDNFLSILGCDDSTSTSTATSTSTSTATSTATSTGTLTSTATSTATSTGTTTATATTVSPVPEPASVGLWALGGLILAAYGRRKVRS